MNSTFQKNNKTIQNLYNRGIQRFNQKDFDSALNLFNQVIKLQPNHVQACHSIGTVLASQGKVEESMEYFKKALNIMPDYLPSIFNYGLSLYNTGLYNEAIELYLKLIEKKHLDYQVLLNLGNCYFKILNYEKAIFYYQKASVANPKRFEPFMNIGAIKKIQEKKEEALEFLNLAYKLENKNPILIYHLGDYFFKYKDYDRSAEYFLKVLEFDNNNYDAVEKYAHSILMTGQYDQALKIYRELLENLKKNFDEERVERFYMGATNAIIRLNKDDFSANYDEAYEFCLKSLDINPDNFSILINAGICCVMNWKYKEAISFFSRAEELKPESRAVLKNIVNAHNHFGKYEETVKYIRKLKSLYPGYKRENMKLATALLSLNKFSEAWEYYEDRWDKESGSTIAETKIPPTFTKPRWEPKLGYESVLVWAEQGLGDQILFGTMVEDFSKKFKKVHLSVDPKLCRFFQEALPHVNVLSLFDHINQDFFDYEIPLTSIGQYCRNSVDDFLPLRVPYQVHKVISDDKTPKKEKLKCALSWKSKGQKADYKSMNLNLLSKILKLENIDFYNIQYNSEEQEILKFYDEHGVKILEPDGVDAHKDIYGLMKFLQTCDFAITTSNTNAHLAGAVGLPTYLLLAQAYGKFWYWDNLHQNQNLWYPTVERFTQEEPNNWDTPVSYLKDKLIEKYDLS